MILYLSPIFKKLYFLFITISNENDNAINLKGQILINIHVKDIVQTNLPIIQFETVTIPVENLKP